MSTETIYSRLWLKNLYAKQKVRKTTLDKDCIILKVYNTPKHFLNVHKNEKFSYLNFAPATFLFNLKFTQIYSIHTRIYTENIVFLYIPAQRLI